MPPLSQANMMEATRLTREGRLAEAMAVLQGTAPAAPAANPEQAAGVDPSGSRPPLIDMVPPPAGSGGAWTAPLRGHAPPQARDGGAMPREVPAALRGLMDRMGGLGQGLGAQLGGLAARGTPVSLPDGARFEERLYTNAAGSRPYKLYVPSTFTGEALPLVVMLHGCTQSPDDFAAGTRMNELAEEFGFFVAYPGQTQAANMQKCWNWFNAADQQRDQGEP